jgi:hypothetical protein
VEEKKRSNIVLLTLVGLPAAVFLAEPLIPQGEQVRRNLYPDRTACERDYSPQQCQQGSGSSSGGWHGPYYSSNRYSAQAGTDPGVGRTGTAHPVEVSTRGGFGAFGRAMHAAA